MSPHKGQGPLPDGWRRVGSRVRLFNFFLHCLLPAKKKRPPFPKDAGKKRIAREYVFPNPEAGRGLGESTCFNAILSIDK